MQLSDLSAAALRQACQESFDILARDARAHHADAQFSHLCLRSADDTDFKTLTDLATTLGAPTHDPQRRIVWVRLTNALYTDLGNTLGGANRVGRLQYLELTPPKPGAGHSTGPQMLVCARAQLAADAVEKLPSPSHPGWQVRFQKQHAEALSVLRQ